MNISKIIYILTFTSFLFSCRKENSEEIDQREIYTDYRIIYKEDVNRTFVRATFRHNDNIGENLILGSDALILAEGNEMKWNSSFWRYEKDFSGMRDITLKFKDNDGNIFNNSLSFNKVAKYEKLTLGNDSLYKDSVQFIPWNNSDSLVSGERVNLILIQNTTIVEVDTDTVGAKGIYLKKTILNTFQLGNINVHFEKWIDTPVKVSNAGGFGKSQTISITKTVKLLN